MMFLTIRKLRNFNLIPFIIYFLIYVIIFTTISKVVDDSFARWTFKDFTNDISSSFNGLPWSLWSIVIALSDLVEEVVSEFRFFKYYILPFTIPPTIISYYCSGRGRRNGIRTERYIWLEWYQSEINNEAAKDTRPLPIQSGSIIVNSHIRRIIDTVKIIVRTPILFVRHFIYHLIAFSILALIRSITLSLTIDIILLLVITILSTICTVASTYIEANSIINGAESERHVWIKWYFANYGNTLQVKQPPDPPNSVHSNFYTIFKRLKSILILIFHQPISIILHFVFWIISSHLIYSLSLGFWISLKPDRISRLLMEYSISAIVFTLIILYRKAIGRQRGRSIEQEKCVNDYSDIFQKVSTNIIKTDRYSTLDSYDLYFLTLHKSVQVIFRKPQILVYHFVGWSCSMILLYGFTDWLLLERLDNFVQLLVIIILTFFTSILETQQNIVGKANQRQTWTDWHDRLIEVKNEDLSYTELPPIID